MIPQWVRDHSLSLALAALFLTMTAYTLAVAPGEWASEQIAHGEPAGAAWVAWAFWRWWTFEYAMSNLADVFGGLILVLFTKRLREKGSAASKE